ncbi:MAG TPA: ATP-dependent Clp protease ATP-binding subunit ClpA [Spirochaetota bacterium]|nr:ATP-dependent Clp protease ATP-binding subunit ClpA [Spirochaetota bacterium]HOL57332.1 ATP-dependent Clp protease ATP-binding subunit ClpA [Spirochaetota bacterium]HPP04883.1 ATP-dependent Clp protease ATP-binding subunit ClpA [Spirochaetota bacterium]
MIGKNLEMVLNSAFFDVRKRRNIFLTTEHLLYAIIRSDEGREIIVNSGGNIESLKKNLTEYLDTLEKSESDDYEPQQTLTFQRVMQRAFILAQSAEKKEIEIGDIIISMFDEEESFSKYFLEKSGLTKLSIMEYVSHGTVSNNEEPAFDFREEEEDIDESNELNNNRDRNNQKQQNDKALNKYLEKYTINMTENARLGKYDKLIGRENEIKRTIEILCRRQKNNPVHVGEPGVGKTAITEGLAQLIVQNKVPDKLKDYKIFAIDIGAILAGTKYRGEFEERFKGVLKAISQLKKCIIFIDEIHTIVGAGAVSGGSMDASNLIKPFLVSSDFRCIGATTYQEYKQYFEKDRALSRRFQKIDIKEPSVEDTIKILEGIKDRYEEYHQVKYSENAIKACAELSAKFINDRHLPDKAIDLLDEAGAYVSLYHPGQKVVTIKDIENLVSRIAQIPVKTIDKDEQNNLKDLATELKKYIYGQDKAINSIVNAIKRHRVGLGHPEKPIGSFLFIGPTGVGKTELCRVLARELGIKLIRFDMSEYMEEYSISRLLGSPPGYVGYEQGAALTDVIIKNPHSVLLLDEIEKAHPNIFNALLQIMDHASITDRTGRTADFRNVILIMTSNVGSREMNSFKIGFNNSVEGNLIKGDPMTAVKDTFSPEFRNRLDEIVVFNSLSQDAINKIVLKFIKELEDQLKEKKIKINITEKAISYIAKKGFDILLGARPMARVIQEEVKDKLTDLILDGIVKKDSIVTIDCEDDKLKFST